MSAGEIDPDDLPFCVPSPDQTHEVDTRPKISTVSLKDWPDSVVIEVMCKNCGRTGVLTWTLENQDEVDW